MIRRTAILLFIILAALIIRANSQTVQLSGWAASDSVCVVHFDGLSNATKYRIRYRPAGSSVWLYATPVIYSSTLLNVLLPVLMSRTTYEYGIKTWYGATYTYYSSKIFKTN